MDRRASLTKRKKPGESALTARSTQKVAYTKESRNEVRKARASGREAYLRRKLVPVLGRIRAPRAHSTFSAPSLARMENEMEELSSHETPLTRKIEILEGLRDAISTIATNSDRIQSAVPRLCQASAGCKPFYLEAHPNWRPSGPACSCWQTHPHR